MCLIPDDDETEVTDAEREKARQVREDADKEDEEQLEIKESKILMFVIKTFIISINIQLQMMNPTST